MPVPTLVRFMIALVVAVMVLGLLYAERTTNRTLRAITKTLASLGFIAVAVEAGAVEHPLGRLVLAGLVLSAVGDVCLLSKAKHWFLAGLVAFLLAHVAYGVGFTTNGVDHKYVGVFVAALFGAGTVVWRWLGPHVRGTMRYAVLVYIAVINWMLATALETSRTTGLWMLLVGALLFYLSDLFVARERFVSPGFVNKLLGLPLYYGGQLVLALSFSGTQP